MLYAHSSGVVASTPQQSRAWLGTHVNNANQGNCTYNHDCGPMERSRIPYRGFPTRMVYLYYILIIMLQIHHSGNPRYNNWMFYKITQHRLYVLHHYFSMFHIKHCVWHFWLIMLLKYTSNSVTSSTATTGPPPHLSNKPEHNICCENGLAVRQSRVSHWPPPVCLTIICHTLTKTTAQRHHHIHTKHDPC